MDNITAEQYVLMARHILMDSSNRLALFNKGQFVGNNNDGVSVRIFGVNDGLLAREPALSRLWAHIIDQMSSTPVTVTSKYCANLTIERVVEDGMVAATLLGAIKTMRRPRLLLKVTPNGALFASKVLHANSTVQQLAIDGGDESAPLKSEKVVADLVKAVINHPTLEMICIANCDLSQKPIIKALAPVLNYIEEVQFTGAGVGCSSYGPELIATILASNPRVKRLSLAFNALKDGDAIKLAEALKTNTTLRALSLVHNDFKRDGTTALFRAIVGDGGLNSASDANHHCCIDLFVATGINLFEDPYENRKLKLLSEFTGDIGCLSDVPIELFPRLLSILQGRVSNDETMCNNLSVLFSYVREYNATICNTSGKGPMKDMVVVEPSVDRRSS